MKKISLVLLSLVLILSAFLTGCSDKPDGYGIKIRYTIDGHLHAQFTDATVPHAPQKSSYEFDGWFFDEEFTIPFSYDKVAEFANGAEEITVYGKWKVSDHAHRMVHKKGKAATCTEDGVLEHYLCSDCGLAYLDEAGTALAGDTVIKSGHNISFVKEKKESCTEDGNIAHYFCSVCKKYYSDEGASQELFNVKISAHHEFSDEWSSNGESHWHASTCGHNIKGSEAAHTYEDGICSVCGISEFAYLVFTKTGNAYSVKASALAEGMSTITVPATYAGLSVTEIEDGGFSNLEALRKLVTSQNLTSIGAEAFKNCYSLTSVTVGKSVSEIKSDAFLNCYALVEVYNLSDTLDIDSEHQSKLAAYALDVYTDSSAQSKLSEQNECVFYKNGSTTYLIKYFGNSAALTLDFSFSNSSYSIYDYAFYKSNVEKLKISEYVTGIGKYAFAESKSLESVEIKKCVDKIADYAFFGCTALYDNEIKCEYKEDEKPDGYSDKFNLRAEDDLIKVYYGYKPPSALPIQPF